MTLCTSLYHGDGGNNNDLTARKYVIIRLFTQQLGLDHSKTNNIHKRPGITV